MSAQNLGKQFDYFKGSKFGDDEGNTFSVEDVLKYAQTNHQKYFRANFPMKKIAHNREHWQGNEERMNAADTDHPMLVVKEGRGKKGLSVADGLNRLEKKARRGDTKAQLYLIPKKHIMHLAKKAQ